MNLHLNCCTADQLSAAERQRILELADAHRQALVGQADCALLIARLAEEAHQVRAGAQRGSSGAAQHFARIEPQHRRRTGIEPL